MRKAGKRIHVLAMVLALAMVITACQVPEGVEIPSGVSVPSDISDLTSEELEQLESYLARYLDSRNLNSMNERNAYTKGGFAHFKWVLDRETKRYTYYWNGQLVEENLAAQFGAADQTPALKYIRFHINKETLADGVTSLDSKLYVDNLKIYVTDSAE